MRESTHSFELDYPCLALADRVIVDSATVELLCRQSHPTFSPMAEALEILSEEGFLELADYRQILDEEATLLTEMLVRDLRHPEDWDSVFDASTSLWDRFVRSQVSDEIARLIVLDNIDRLPEDVGGFQRSVLSHAWGPKRPRSEGVFITDIRGFLKTMGDYIGNRESETPPAVYHELAHYAAWEQTASGKRHRLEAYLRYVNANLVISRRLDAAIYDWQDFGPFYREKFIRLGHESPPGESERRQIRKLFDFSFPQYRIRDVRTLVRALEDKRVRELRELVSAAARDEVAFDAEFGRATMAEVFRIKKQVGKMRRIVARLTLPLGLLGPGVSSAAQLASELAEAGAERALFRKHRWFYLLDDIVGES